jgi:thiamine-phosphate pyrophosphorylase
MQISSLHFITDRPEHAEQACRGGVRWVQLRVKNATPDHWRQLALDTRAICQRYGATLIINDNPPLALEIGADGVHLGQQDMPAAEARALVRPGKLVGGTANTFEDIEQLVRAGVDYIGLGPFRFTTTKEKLSPILGLEGYSAIMDQCRVAGLNIPVIAIGGIQKDDVALVLSTLVHGIAVSGAIVRAADPTAAAKQLVEHVNFWRVDYQDQ